jgi:hypothetical protein
LFWDLQAAFIATLQNAQVLSCYYTKRFIIVTRSPDNRRVAQLTFCDEDRPLELTVGVYGAVGPMSYSITADYANNVVVNGVSVGGVERFTDWLLGEVKKPQASEERLPAG